MDRRVPARYVHLGTATGSNWRGNAGRRSTVVGERVSYGLGPPPAGFATPLAAAAAGSGGDPLWQVLAGPSAVVVAASITGRVAWKAIEKNDRHFREGLYQETLRRRDALASAERQQTESLEHDREMRFIDESRSTLADTAKALRRAAAYAEDWQRLAHALQQGHGGAAPSTSSTKRGRCFTTWTSTAWSWPSAFRRDHRSWTLTTQRSVSSKSQSTPYGTTRRGSCTT